MTNIYQSLIHFVTHVVIYLIHLYREDIEWKIFFLSIIYLQKFSVKILHYTHTFFYVVQPNYCSPTTSDEPKPLVLSRKVPSP